MRLPDFGASRAVLIGTAYHADDEIPDLPQVENNLSDLREVLASDLAGFPESRISVVRNPAAQSEVMDAVVSAADATDVLLVYYAGHGLLMGDQSDLHLTLTTSRADAEWTVLRFALVAAVMKRSRAATKVLVVDCCYSGHVHRDLMAEQGAVVDDQLRIDGVYTISATSRVKKAKAPECAVHTAFTGTLLEVARQGIRSGRQLLGMPELFSQVERMMRQHPEWPLPQQSVSGNASGLALLRNAGFSAAASTDEYRHVLDFGRSRAVVVGTGNYVELPEVPSSLNDARAVYGSLLDPAIFGFEEGCTLLLDPENPMVIARELQRAAEAAEDFLFFYASGHGIVGADGEPFLATSTCDNTFLPFTALSGTIMADILGSTRARSIVVVIDGCFSGRFSHALARRGPRNLVFLGSTPSNHPAITDGEHGLFTRALLRQFRSGKPDGPIHLTASDIFSSVIAEYPLNGPSPVFSAHLLSESTCLCHNPAWKPNGPASYRCATRRPIDGD